MDTIGAVFLLISAITLAWSNRPAARGEQWPGSAAARFAAALMLLGFAVTAILHALVPDDEIVQTELLMRQLSLYAALPMLVCTHIAERLRYHLTRQMWGRIFLGWCVVFELARRADVLQWVLLATLVAGGVMLLLPMLHRDTSARLNLPRQQRFWYLTFPAMAWVLLHLSPDHTLSTSLTSLWLAILVGLLLLAQPVSYRLAADSEN
jgi:predicted membrane channel-forming protein YqfA (hemolysin III family)